MWFNPGGPGQSGVELVRSGRARALGVGRRPVRHRVVGSPGHVCQLADALLRERRRGGGVLEGRRHPVHSRAVGCLSAEDGGPRPAVRRGDGPAAVAHLDGRHRPRPRRHASALGRGADHLRGHVLRHHARADLRQHVPQAGAGDDARRRRRRRPLHDQRRGPRRQQRRIARCRLRPVRRAVRCRRPDPLRAGGTPRTDRGPARGPAVRHAPDRHHPGAERRPAGRARVHRPPALLVLRAAQPGAVAGLGRAVERRRRRRRLGAEDPGPAAGRRPSRGPRPRSRRRSRASTARPSSRPPTGRP